MQTTIREILDTSNLAGLLQKIGRAADRLGIETYVVGGFVRDLFLDRPTNDLDFVSVGPGSGLALAKLVAEQIDGTTVHRYEQFGTAAIRAFVAGNSVQLEFVAARKESYRAASRKPIVEDATLEEDLSRRDFTVNAMAVSLNSQNYGALVDLFGGMHDLDKQVLRTPVDPDVTYADDPLRAVRAARFAAQLGFAIADESLVAMKQQADRIGIVSMERITEELHLIMKSSKPSVGLKILYEAGILQHIFSELTDLAGVETIDGQGHKDNFFHTLGVVDNLVDRVGDRPADETLWLRWAALLHDIGKPRTKRYSKSTGWTFHGHEERGARMVSGIFRKLKLPRDERMKYVQKMIRLHHRPVALVDDNVTDSAVRRLLFDAGDDIDDLMNLVKADITSKNPRRRKKYLNAFNYVDERLTDVEEKDHLRAFQPPVDGNEIMETLEIPPGRLVGVLKTAVREAILEGKIPNDHDAAFEYLMAVKDDLIAAHAE